MDGAWKHFDATSDRGRAGYGFKYFAANGGQMSSHIWEEERAKTLTELFVL